MAGRARAHLAAVTAVAVLAALLATAAASGPAAAADPVAFSPQVWRGWVAAQQDVNADGPSGGQEWVDRTWWVDDSTTSTAVVFGADFHHYTWSRTEECFGESETGGEVTGAAQSQVELSSDVGWWAPELFPDGTDGMFFGMFSLTPSTMEHSGRFITCEGDNRALSGTTSTTRILAGNRAGVPLDITAPLPMTVSGRFSHAWTDTNQHTFVVCMTRSTVDTDGDDLPDPVDLAPTEFGSAVDLGSPAGMPFSEVTPHVEGVTPGKQGLPDCPGDGGPDRDGDRVVDANDNCPDDRNEDQQDADRDGIGDECEPLDAIDDPLGSFAIGEYDNALELYVLDNDIGDDLRVWNVAPVDHDEGSLTLSDAGDAFYWIVTGVDPGVYQFEYTVRDRYGRFDTAVAAVRFGCTAEQQHTTAMHWDAVIDGPGKDLDLYNLDADVTYCESGHITDFTLTPSADSAPNLALNLLGFDLRAGDVTYSPPRTTYPKMTVTAATTVSLCFNPGQMAGGIVSRAVGGVARELLERTVERNLRRSGEWTLADLRTALEESRDEFLKQIRRGLNRVPGLSPQAADTLFELVAGPLRVVINEAIDAVEAKAGASSWVGGLPDETAERAVRFLFKELEALTWICDGMEIWAPEVTVEGRPGWMGPLIGIGATDPNPFLSIV